MRLRYIPSLLAVQILFGGVAHASPAHVWSHRTVQPDDQWFARVAIDAAGNIVTCGNFYNSLNLGQVYPSAGFQDAFVAKFDPAGNLLWVHQLGDVRPDQAWDITTDGAGNVICVGHMSAGMNDQDAVVVKYGPDGTERWLERFGTGDMHYQTAMVVATNLSKEIIFAGEFDGAFSVGGPTLQPTGGITFYMAKLDQNGNHLWSKGFTTSSPFAYNLDGLETGADGNSMLCGALLDSLDVGNGTLKSAGLNDIFLARFDADGNAQWSHRYGDAQAQEARDIAMNANGEIAIAGATNGSIDFGGGPLTAGSDYDPFVAVLSSSGAHVWSRIFNATSNQYAGSLTWASNHDLLVAWRGTGSLDFGGGMRTISGPTYGVWLTRFFGNNGTHRWSTTVTSSSGMDGQIDEDNGQIVLAGGVGGTVDFGAGSTSGEADYYDLYLAKFDDGLTAAPSRINFGELGQNLPNPFNPTTSIPYTLRATARARIMIHNVSGALVSVLDAGVQPAGTHTMAWNGRDARGNAVASGVYFYQLEGSADAPRKMVLVK
jgi:hypothetical protein